MTGTRCACFRPRRFLWFELPTWLAKPLFDSCGYCGGYGEIEQGTDGQDAGPCHCCNVDERDRYFASFCDECEELGGNHERWCTTNPDYDGGPDTSEDCGPSLDEQHLAAWRQKYEGN